MCEKWHKHLLQMSFYHKTKNLQVIKMTTTRLIPRQALLWARRRMWYVRIFGKNVRSRKIECFWKEKIFFLSYRIWENWRDFVLRKLQLNNFCHQSIKNFQENWTRFDLKTPNGIYNIIIFLWIPYKNLMTIRISFTLPLRLNFHNRKRVKFQHNKTIPNASKEVRLQIYWKRQNKNEKINKRKHFSGLFK